MSISKTGFWNVDGQNFEKEHAFDKSLANNLLRFFQAKQVKKMYDFGCGPGKQTLLFRQNDIESTGFDGNPITVNFPHCKVADLTQNMLEEKVDCIMCLEVGEHIPAEQETNLLHNIDKHLNSNGLLVLSWAVRGQGGFGHVNCLDNHEVVKKITSLGYQQNEWESLQLRSKVDLPWFRNTIMVFQKK